MAFINRVVTRIICDIIKSGPQEPEPGNLQIRPVYQAVYVLGLAEQYIVGPGPEPGRNAAHIADDRSRHAAVINPGIRREGDYCIRRRSRTHLQAVRSRRRIQYIDRRPRRKDV